MPRVTQLVSGRWDSGLYSFHVISQKPELHQRAKEPQLSGCPHFFRRSWECFWIGRKLATSLNTLGTWHKPFVWRSFFKFIHKHWMSTIYQPPQLGTGTAVVNKASSLNLRITPTSPLCSPLQLGAQVSFAHSQPPHDFKGTRDAHRVWHFPK